MSEYQTLREALDKPETVDENTLEAKAILDERLMQLKDTNPIFADVHFSENVNAFCDDMAALA
jgi:hypothetical protein